MKTVKQGRPKKHSDRVTVSISMDAKDRDFFDQLALLEGKNRSEFLRHLLDLYKKAARVDSI